VIAHNPDFQHFPRWLLMLLVFFLIDCLPYSVTAQKSSGSEQPVIEIAFCLDLSGSTNGLIDNFRESIWSVINHVELYKPAQQLRIGIVGFSRPSFGKNSAYVKVLSNLTTNFDRMVADLWKLKPEVEKGDQFVSNALTMTGSGLNWSKSPKTIRIIFLIGNGNVDTGSGDYRTAVNELKEDGFILIPVYCLQSRKSKEIAGWQQIGIISGTTFESIYVDRRIPLAPPIEEQGVLQYLVLQLDKQLVPYTTEGQVQFSRTVTCDNKILTVPAALENRMNYRISDSFLTQTKRWDLVAADIKNPNDLLNYDTAFLNDSLKKLNTTQLFENIQQKRINRDNTLIKIKKLLPQIRQEYFNELVSRQEFETEFILEKVILKSISDVCSKRGIVVK